MKTLLLLGLLVLAGCVTQPPLPMDASDAAGPHEASGPRQYIITGHKGYPRCRLICERRPAGDGYTCRDSRCPS
jgi:hypothetical protein